MPALSHDVTETAAHAAWLDEILACHGADLVALLQEIQKKFGQMPKDVLTALAARSGISLARIFGVATFYGSFSLKRRGRVVIRVCKGTACHVRGATRITEAIGKRLDIPPGGTTSDLAFTLETVACLGCCSLAPVMTVGSDTHARLDRQRAVAAVDECADQAAGRAPP